MNLNESKSAPSYSKADRFCTLFHLVIAKFDSRKLQLKECNYSAPLQPKLVLCFAGGKVYPRRVNFIRREPYGNKALWLVRKVVVFLLLLLLFVRVKFTLVW